jgi:putative SOS response-associated peptidase YedK
MCGRFTLRSRLNRVIPELNLFGDLDWEPRFNIAPTQPVPIVRLDAASRRAVALARWGLVPSWVKDLKSSAPLINARAETVAEKPAFRSAFCKRRCLILADGYYEWRPVGKKKQPYFIRRADDAPFGFAGLWESRPDDDGTALESCTIITSESNELTRPVHDRTPVILDIEDWDSWLATNAEPAGLRTMLRPYRSDLMAVDPVSPLVNNARNDVPECVRVVDA